MPYKIPYEPQSSKETLTKSSEQKIKYGYYVILSIPNF
jgi:hypothetical protein